jgi:hypothetical protein
VPAEPDVKRTVAFFDGQNLFHHAQEAFGYKFPNFSPLALASRICGASGFNLHKIHFYTGVPGARDDPFWHRFWVAKLLAICLAWASSLSLGLCATGRKL